jgi:hypothetical protein
LDNKGIEAVSVVILKPVLISPFLEKVNQNEPSPSIIPAIVLSVSSLLILFLLLGIKDKELALERPKDFL